MSLTTWFILIGAVLIWAFVVRQRHLVATDRPPLVDVTLFRILRLRSGLTVLLAQYAMTAGLFFMMPVYLQMTLGLDALQTGIRIFPLSISLILFSIFGTRLALIWSPRRIIRVGQVLLVFASFLLLGAVDIELQSPAFGLGMFVAGAALGLLASQIGNVNMSSVGEEQSSEVGGLQGVFQNLGSSLGTALIGSVLIGALATSFASGVAASDLPQDTQVVVAEATEGGRRHRARGIRARPRGGGGPRRRRGRGARARLRELADRVAAGVARGAHRDRPAVAVLLARDPDGGRGATAQRDPGIG